MSQMLCLAGFSLLEGTCFKRSVFAFSTNKVKMLASFRKRFLHIFLVSKYSDLYFPVPQIKSSCLVIYLNIFTNASVPQHHEKLGYTLSSN